MVRPARRLITCLLGSIAAIAVPFVSSAAAATPAPLTEAQAQTDRHQRQRVWHRAAGVPAPPSWAGSRDSPQIRSPEFPTLVRA
jgi:hypothetical protein